MTKRELSEQLAASCGLTQAKASDVVDTLLDLIGCHFIEGGQRLSLRGFGTFSARKRRAFQTTDPINKRRITVDARIKLHFKPSPELIGRINAL